MGRKVKKKRRLHRAIKEVAAVQGSFRAADLDVGVGPPNSPPEANVAVVVEDVTSDTNAGEAKWPEFAAWICESDVPQGPLLRLRPGFGSAEMSTIGALESLRDQLLYKALYEALSVEQVNIRVGAVVPDGKNGTKILLNRIPGSTGKDSSKHCLAWVIGIETVCSVLFGTQRHVRETHGERRYIAAEAMNYVTVKPLLKDFAGVDGPRVPIEEHNCLVAVVLLADLHRYFFIYEALRQMASACRIPASVGVSVQTASGGFRDQLPSVEAPVLRAWFGLNVSVPPCAYALLGGVRERRQRIAHAEWLLNKELTPSQLESIMHIKKHVTVWDEIAGSGKTLKMLLLAVMATVFTKDSLVIFAGSSHRVASCFEEIAKKVFPLNQMLPLRVTATAGQVVDRGLKAFQQIVDAATTEEIQVLACIDCIIDMLVTAIEEHEWGYAASPDGDTVMKLVVQLLADRHEYLDQHVYSCVETVQAGVMAEIRLLTTTIATLAKINSHQSPWYSWFPAERQFLVIVDELPDESMESIAACLGACDLFVGGGDMQQFRDVNPNSGTVLSLPSLGGSAC